MPISIECETLMLPPPIPRFVAGCPQQVLKEPNAFSLGYLPSLFSDNSRPHIPAGVFHQIQLDRQDEYGRPAPG
jgi:hypothetical protein